MKKILFALISLVIVLLICCFIVVTYFPHKLVPIALDRQISRLMADDEILQNEDAIVVYTIGTSSPLPGKRAQTGTALMINGHFFIFDVGDGVVQKAENMRLPLDKLSAIFITHWHSDHFIDLPYLINRSWVLGRSKELHVYGPDGLDTLMYAVNQFLHIENQYRVDHHGESLMDITKAEGIPHEFKNIENKKEVIFEKDGITITAFDVNHEPVKPAVGYVIEYNSKKVVISGDTKKNDLLIEVSENADILIHEVILNSLLEQVSQNLEQNNDIRNSQITKDVQNYHTAPSQVSEIAERANVKKLILNHFAPAPDNIIIKKLYRREMKDFKGPVIFAKDGDKFIVE